MKKTIAFAYYADNKFIGWYGGTFGPVSDVPKLYTNSESQIDVVTKNFRNKIKKINEIDFKQARDEADSMGKAIGLLVFDSQDTLRGKDVELRIVECPIYDGPNPDFDRELYNQLLQEQKDLMENEGIFNIPAPSLERSEAIKKFYEKCPRPVCNNWIYADYSEVKKWASEEPKEFIATIKSNL
jgi:hypothetical protein